VIRDIDRRLSELERRRSRSAISREPTYTIIREGEPRPQVAGPVYVLVSPQPGRIVHA
jgi:hypothetical protein